MTVSDIVYFMSFICSVQVQMHLVVFTEEILTKEYNVHLMPRFFVFFTLFIQLLLEAFAEQLVWQLRAL